MHSAALLRLAPGSHLVHDPYAAKSHTWVLGNPTSSQNLENSSGNVWRTPKLSAKLNPLCRHPGHHLWILGGKSGQAQFTPSKHTPSSMVPPSSWPCSIADCPQGGIVAEYGLWSQHTAPCPQVAGTPHLRHPSFWLILHYSVPSTDTQCKHVPVQAFAQAGSLLVLPYIYRGPSSLPEKSGWSLEVQEARSQPE